MPSTYFESYDQIRKRFETHWLDWITNGIPENIHNPTVRQAPIVFSKIDGSTYTPKIYWADKVDEQDPDPTEHWVRFHTDEISNEQQTFPSSASEPIRYRVHGIVVVELYFSKLNYAHDHRKLSVIARNIFKPRNLKCNPIWYMNASIKHLKSEEKYLRNNVISEYKFDEFI